MADATTRVGRQVENPPPHVASVTVVVDERAIVSLLGIRRTVILHAKNVADIESICSQGGGTLDGYSSLYETLEGAWRGALAMVHQVVTTNASRQVPLPVRAILITTSGEVEIMEKIRSLAPYIGTISKSLLVVMSEGYVTSLGVDALGEIVGIYDVTPVWLDVGLAPGTTTRLLRLVNREQQMQSIFRPKLLTLYDGPYYIANYTIHHDDIYQDILTGRYGAIECLHSPETGGLVAIYETASQILQSLHLGDVITRVDIHCGYDIVLKKTSRTLEGSTYGTLKLISSLRTNGRLVVSSDAYEWCKSLLGERVFDSYRSVTTQVPSSPVVVHILGSGRNHSQELEVCLTPGPPPAVVVPPTVVPAGVPTGLSAEMLLSALTEISERLSKLEEHLIVTPVVPVSSDLVDLSDLVINDIKEEVHGIAANYSLMEPLRDVTYDSHDVPQVATVDSSEMRTAIPLGVRVEVTNPLQ